MDYLRAKSSYLGVNSADIIRTNALLGLLWSITGEDLTSDFKVPSWVTAGVPTNLAV